MSQDSEFRAYHYIERVLKDLGWDTRNPSRGGQVYTQGEFRNHDPLLTRALGQKAPENIILISWNRKPCYWIIEAKNSHKKLKKALEEAKGYADKINESEGKVAKFITGLAGTPDSSFLVETHYWNDKEWHEVAINNYKTTGFLSLEQCHDILTKNSHQITHFDDDPNRFLKKANAINKTLHNNGVPAGDRAHVMAALLLSLAQDGNMRIDDRPTALVREINGNIEDLLRKHGKEEFAGTIKLTLPATEKNHKRYRKAIVETLQYMREMNIRSAINSGDDSLGKFYETFLKYTNDAKEIGIVLTPRHITKFAVDVLGIGPNDRIFDPTCGTGGFLVSAMDKVRLTVGGGRPQAYESFRDDGLYGVEEKDDVYGLAIVNMIFRGDGKSHIYDGNCFDHQFWIRDNQVFYTMPEEEIPEGANKPFSRVLMNPPFKISRSESEFIDYALAQTKEGGLLFAVLPAVIIGGIRDKRGFDFPQWRSELLKRHSVKAVLKLDKNVFYPIAEGTYILILEAHKPHVLNSEVFMGMLFDDKHRPRKSKMLSDYDMTDNVEIMTEELRRFLVGQSVELSKPREQVVTTLNPDHGCLFSPEAYLKNKQPETLGKIVDRTIALSAAKLTVTGYSNERPINPVMNLKSFLLKDFIGRIVSPPLKASKGYPSGNIPVVSATAKNNGISAWKDIPHEKRLQNLITISKTHNTQPCEAFWHPYEFSAIATVHIIKLIPEFMESEFAILFICQSITDNNAWRYDYARDVKLDELEVYLPVKNGMPDIDAIIEKSKQEANEFLWENQYSTGKSEQVPNSNKNVL